MNNIQYLIDQIKFQIPYEILNLGLSDFTYGLNYNNSSSYSLNPISQIMPNIDTMLELEIINNKVKRDCNIVSGQEAVIFIDQNNLITQLQGGTIIIIRPEQTQGREIINAMSVTFNWQISIGTGMGPNIATSAVGPEPTSSTRIRLVNKNVLFVENIMAINIASVRVLLEYEEGFNNINSKVLFILSELCVLATKAYLYSKLKIRLANATVIGGVDISAISNIVDEYADAINIYNETLITKWRTAAHLSDPISKERFIRMILPY